MRVVAGDYRGHTLKPVPGEGTRPTIDRVREAMASSIVSRRGPIEGASVLDAFSGSGALGIEMLSRGAAHATFLDSDRKAIATIRGNIASVGADDRSAVRTLDTFAFASAGGTLPGAPFDLVFLDPPYAHTGDEVAALVVAFAVSGLLADEAIIVYEHRTGAFDPDTAEALLGYNGNRPGDIEGTGLKRYGATEVSYLRYRKGE